MNSTSIHRQHTDKGDVRRGPNEEAVGTAQDNVRKGYGSSRKASLISGKPDGGTGGGRGASNAQGQPAANKGR